MQLSGFVLFIVAIVGVGVTANVSDEPTSLLFRGGASSVREDILVGRRSMLRAGTGRHLDEIGNVRSRKEKDVRALRRKLGVNHDGDDDTTTVSSSDSSSDSSSSSTPSDSDETPTTSDTDSDETPTPSHTHSDDTTSSSSSTDYHVVTEEDFKKLDLTFDSLDGDVNLEYKIDGIKDTLYFPESSVEVNSHTGDVTFSMCAEPPEGVPLPWDIDFDVDDVNYISRCDHDDPKLLVQVEKATLMWEYDHSCDTGHSESSSEDSHGRQLRRKRRARARGNIKARGR